LDAEFNQTHRLPPLSAAAASSASVFPLALGLWNYEGGACPCPPGGGLLWRSRRTWSSEG